MKNVYFYPTRFRYAPVEFSQTAFKSMDLQLAQAALKRYFGYSSFRPLQEQVIQTIYAGRDCLVLMPTGGGKSICYQLPAVTLPGTCLVVSPLIALMKDQVEGLRANGINAAFLNSSQSLPEQRKIEEAFFQGKLELLYVSPEKLLSGGFFPILQRAKLNLFAIDEAHCISAWGHDFRPEYTQLRLLKQHFPRVPVVALTATADKVTRFDILQQLGVPQAESFIASFDRPNISLTVSPGQKRLEQILNFLKRRPRQSGIVYCLSRRGAEDLAQKLQGAGYKAAAYHAGLSASERNAVQEAFINDQTPIICATIAFGMGIDKSNVRWVIHYNLPKNLEGYYQEIGRAGRDGAKAEALLFYSFGDVSMLRDIILGGASDQIEVQMLKLERMQQYAESLACRRRILLAYFGERVEKGCGNCDVCQNPPQYFDGTVLAQKALSAVYRLSEQVGQAMLIDVLRGARRKEVLQAGFDQIKTFGAGRDLSQWEWQQYLAQLINLGYLEIAYNQNQVLKLTESSQNVLFHGAKVQLVRTSTLKERQAADKAAAQQVGKGEKINAELYETLVEVRTQVSRDFGLPPYLVFSDATLEAMAKRRPQTAVQLLEVPGVGQKKLEQFGAIFLQAIQPFVAPGQNNNRSSTVQITENYFREGLTPAEIAEKRGLTQGTIYQHLVQLYEAGAPLDISSLVPQHDLYAILNATPYLVKPTTLRAYFEYFDGKYSYEQIRLALAHQARESKV